MNQHLLFEFMRQSHDFYDGWPSYKVMYRNLRLNTPRGAARWDKQAQSVLLAPVRDGLLEWLPCPDGKTIPSGRPCRHLAMTERGYKTLAAWNEFGCLAHGRVTGKCKPNSDPKLLPFLEHAA